MSNGRKLTFYSLFDEVDYIEIPILQRDYAQGRSEEGEVRALFLRSLFNVLTQESDTDHHSLDLDFVYGNYEGTKNKVFSVLDGQQRLTTLFLLHWYLAVENNEVANFRSHFVAPTGSRFTYKTRPSSTEFFNALVSSDFSLNGEKVSQQVSNCQWFFLSWKQDPTVKACLQMLDSIQEVFLGKTDGLYEKLVDKQYPYITFQFLNLRSFDLSDELYIKMNARGKPLTIFENFKAKLEQYISSCNEPWPSYQLPFKDDLANGYDYFIHKIDTDWADLFWPYRNECSKDNTFDDELMNFLRLIISIQYLLGNQRGSSALVGAKNTLFASQGKLESVPLSRYEELGCFSQGLIIRLIEILDLLYREGLTNNMITPYLEDSYYYSEDETFRKVVTNTAGYDDKLRFYAFYAYLASNKDFAKISDWLRVIYNLVGNTIIDTVDRFYNALVSIKKLSECDSSILDVLSEDCSLTGFLGAQILEEKIKAHLLLKSQEWRDAIVTVERHQFFDGQIGVVLNYSGVLSFYRGHNHCDWSAEVNESFFSQFKAYSDSLGRVFSQIRGSSSSIDYLWERAVLSKGVYCTTATSYRLNLLSSRDTRNNIPRDHSWRRLLRISLSDSDMEVKQEYVKAVLDDPDFDAENIKNSLEKICNRALDRDDLDEWRKELIKHKEHIAYCNQGFISFTNEEVILLSESQRNHYHCELYTKSLEIYFTGNQDLVRPFTKIKYEPVKSRELYACLVISGWVFSDTAYSIRIGFYDDEFILWFNGSVKEMTDDPLCKVLGAHQFEWACEDGTCSYQNKNLNSTSSVIEKIKSLCTDLMALGNK